MLKTFIANPDLSNVEVEEKYKTFALQKRKDTYETACDPVVLIFLQESWQLAALTLTVLFCVPVR